MKPGTLIFSFILAVLIGAVGRCGGYFSGVIHRTADADVGDGCICHCRFCWNVGCSIRKNLGSMGG